MNVLARIAKALESILAVQQQRLEVERQVLTVLKKIEADLEPAPIVAQKIIFAVPK